jgi:hypothetical protein
MASRALAWLALPCLANLEAARRRCNEVGRRGDRSAVRRRVVAGVHWLAESRRCRHQPGQNTVADRSSRAGGPARLSAVPGKAHDLNGPKTGTLNG